MACVRHSDSTWTARNKDAELGAMTSRILSHTTMKALFSSLWSPLPGGMLQSALEEAICLSTSSLKSFQVASSMALWVWVLSTLLLTPNYHRRNLDNPGNFEDCRKGKFALRLQSLQHTPMRTSPFAWRDACLLFPTEISLAWYPSQTPEPS